MDAGGTTQTPFRTGTLIPPDIITRLCPLPGGSLYSVTGHWGGSRPGFFASVWANSEGPSRLPSSLGDRLGPLWWLHTGPHLLLSSLPYRSRACQQRPVSLCTKISSPCLLQGSRAHCDGTCDSHPAVAEIPQGSDFLPPLSVP